MIRGFEKYTEPLSEQQRQIAAWIATRIIRYVGKDNAVPSAKIIEGCLARFGVKVNDSTLRQMINYLRNNNIVPVLCASSRGYFIAANEKEAEDYVASLDDRIGAIAAMRSSVIKQMRRQWNSQLELELPRFDTASGSRPPAEGHEVRWSQAGKPGKLRV